MQPGRSSKSRQEFATEILDWNLLAERLLEDDGEQDRRRFVPWWNSWRIGETIDSPRFREWLEICGREQ